MLDIDLKCAGLWSFLLFGFNHLAGLVITSI